MLPLLRPYYPILNHSPTLIFSSHPWAVTFWARLPLCVSLHTFSSSNTDLGPSSPTYQCLPCSTPPNSFWIKLFSKGRKGKGRKEKKREWSKEKGKESKTGRGRREGSWLLYSPAFTPKFSRFWVHCLFYTHFHLQLILFLQIGGLYLSVCVFKNCPDLLRHNWQKWMYVLY